MLRARITLLILALFPLGAYVGMQSWRSWKLQPLSPARAIATMTVPAGFSVELVAAEPTLVHPLAMTFDERGRLWVVESPGYPADGSIRSPGRIKILESSKGDGTFDKVVPFPAALAMPSSVAVGHGGAWVIDAPDILFFPIRAGVVGPREVVVTGFGKQNSNGLPNSLTWGPDGWLYGLSSVWCENHVTHQGKSYQFSCAMFRIHPRTRAFELFAEGTSNPWGIAWDTEGSAFVSACITDHLWHITETGIYQRITGAYPAFSWPIGSIVRHQHGGHSHCGVHFFDSDAYPPEYRAKLYMGNVSSGDVNIDGLQRDGATYRATVFPDLVASTDEWFTPVAQKTGPDGLLYVLDWYDRVHCLDDQLRRPHSVNQPLGRLYRVRYGSVAPAGLFDLAQESDEQLVQRLHSPNIYFRDTAQRLLIERNHPESRRRLRQLVSNDNAPRQPRLHALWALIGAGSLESDLHQELLRHPDPGFRAWGVRAAGNFRKVDPAIRAQVGSLDQDPSPDVRLQVAIAVRKIEGADPLLSLVRVAAVSAQDRLIPPIVWRNLQPLLDQRGDDFLALIEKQDLLGSAALTPILARALEYLVARPGQDPVKVVAMFRTLTEKKNVDASLARQVLASLADKIQTGEVTAAQRRTLEEWAGPFVRRVLAASPDNPLYLEAALLATTLKDPDGTKVARTNFLATRQAEEVRLKALNALIAGQDPALLDDVARVLTDPQAGSTLFRGRLLTALGRLEDAKVADLVLSRYSQLEADLQPQAVELLIQRPSWSKQLLRAVRDKQVPAGALNVNQVRQLLTSKDQDLIQQVKTQWGSLRAERDPEREQVVARMRTFLRQHRGNATTGQQVFKKLCGQCHKIYGEGAEVGPDLTSTGRTAYDQLLLKVFDPSQLIKAGYQGLTVATTSGRIVTGLVVEDNVSRVVLKIQGGKQETIPRDEVDTTIPSKVSLMPEGIEKQLTPEEIADLFAFLTLDRPPSDPRARKIPGTPP